MEVHESKTIKKRVKNQHGITKLSKNNSLQQNQKRIKNFIEYSYHNFSTIFLIRSDFPRYFLIMLYFFNLISGDNLWRLLKTVIIIRYLP
jgi:hypothetical protein